MIKIIEKADCCGCSACESVCPQACIAMQPDEEGFLYPVTDVEKCVDCGLCNGVCPIINAAGEVPRPQKAYIVNSKNATVRAESTSGGAFTPIAQYIIENGGVVYGAAFDECFNVIHTYADSVEELKKFRGSKYVQSDMGDCFRTAKAFLDNDRLVCFSGVPCQIEGLLRFLKKDYQNLITADVVCRAVPSPLAWRKYLIYRKERLKASEIKSISFRDKSKYGYQFPMLHISTDRKNYYRGIESDPYTRSFFGGMAVRPSCYKCNFRKRYRVSDFTLWDCFFPEYFAPELNDNRGSTNVLIHTEKGGELFKAITDSLSYKEAEPDKLVKDIKEMFKSSPSNAKRTQFFRDIHVMDENDFWNKYFPNTVKSVIMRFAKSLLAKTPFYKLVKKSVTQRG